MLVTMGKVCPFFPKPATAQEMIAVQTTVLIVDDNTTFVGIVARFVGDQPDMTVVGTANNGAEGIKQALELRPQVILLDLVMPGLSGLYALPRLRQQAPDSALIVLTLLEGEGYEDAARDAGADAFVPKSKLYTELIPAIRAAALMASGRALASIQAPPAVARV
jgi:DNA-binding NarL/FixJ family response regulator